MNVILVSRADDLLDAIRQGCSDALTRTGSIAVDRIRTQMLSGYAQPVYDSGALHDSIRYVIEENTLHVGSSLPYAIPVHDGTARMPGRPFLHDGMIGALTDIESALTDTLAAVP